MDLAAADSTAGLLANVVTLAFEKLYDEWRTEAKARVPELSARAIRTVIDREPLLSDPESMLSTPHREDVDAVMRYLMSPDASMFVTDLLAAQLVDGTSEQVDLHTQQCYRSLRFFGASETAATEASGVISTTSRKIVADLLALPSRSKKPDKEAQQRIVAAKARLADRHMQRVEAQLSLLATLLDKERVDLNRLERKLRNLRDAISATHGTIMPPNVDSSRRVPIEDLYVPAQVEVSYIKVGIGDAWSEEKGRYVQAVSYTPTVESFVLPTQLPHLLQRSSRSIILGTPGAGKTTLTTYMAKIIADQSIECSCVVAVPVILREHAGASGIIHGVDIVGALASTCLSRYQVPLTRAEVEFLVSTGRMLVIVDGLDELLATQDRLKVTQSIEAFARVYPDCPLIATSRIVGYEQAPLREDIFAQAQIGPLSEFDVRDYASKWFRIATDLPPDQRDSLVDSFMEDSRQIPDLRQNALLLSLMCGLYRHERQLPRNRPQVYEACSTLLFDTWDRRRQLRPAFDFDANVPGAVQHLARYIFEDQEKQAGITEPELIRVAAAYFREWQYTRDAEAVRAAREFIDFCKGRAWILTDTGSTSDNVPLFGFSHRTFLEYFTAVDIARSLTVDQLKRFFEQRPQDAAWNVVCQILLQLASRKQRGLENLLVNQIHISAPHLPPGERDIALTVALQSLGAVPFKPETVQKTVNRALSQYLKEFARDRRTTRGQRAVIRDSEALRRFREKYWIDGATIAVENHRAAAEIVDKRLNESVETEEQVPFVLAHLVDFHLVEGSSPADLQQSLKPRYFPALKQAVVDTSDPWLLVCGLLLGLVDPAPEEAFSGSFFRATASGTGVVLAGPSSPWGGRQLPTPAEIVVWRSAHQEASAGDVRSLIGHYGAPALSKIRRSETVTAFKSHWIWHSIGQVVASGGGETVDPPDEEDLPYETLLPLVFAMVELYVLNQTGDELYRRVHNLTRRYWGRLNIVPAAVQSRYRTGGPALSPAAMKFLEDMNLGGWCRGSESITRAAKKNRRGRPR